MIRWCRIILLCISISFLPCHAGAQSEKSEQFLNFSEVHFHYENPKIGTYIIRNQSEYKKILGACDCSHNAALRNIDFRKNLLVGFVINVQSYEAPDTAIKFIRYPDDNAIKVRFELDYDYILFELI